MRVRDLLDRAEPRAVGDARARPRARRLHDEPAARGAAGRRRARRAHLRRAAARARARRSGAAARPAAVPVEVREVGERARAARPRRAGPLGAQRVPQRRRPLGARSATPPTSGRCGRCSAGCAAPTRRRIAVVGDGPTIDWGDGDYAPTADALAPASPVVLDAIGLRAGERLIDVGCGTGNALIEAARRGADVAGSIPSPRLVAAGRRAPLGGGPARRGRRRDRRGAAAGHRPGRCRRQRVRRDLRRRIRRARSTGSSRCAAPGRPPRADVLAAGRRRSARPGGSCARPFAGRRAAAPPPPRWHEPDWIGGAPGGRGCARRDVHRARARSSATTRRRRGSPSRRPLIRSGARSARRLDDDDVARRARAQHRRRCARGTRIRAPSR